MSENEPMISYPKDFEDTLKEDYAEIFEEVEVDNKKVFLEKISDKGPVDDSLFCIVDNSVFEFILTDVEHGSLEKIKNSSNLQKLLKIGEDIKKNWNEEEKNLFKQGSEEIKEYAVRYIPKDDSKRVKNLMNELDRRSGNPPKRYIEDNDLPPSSLPVY